MKIVFLGSGSFACPAVKALLDSPRHKLVAVVTQPDRPRGRSLHVAACSVKELVTGRGVPVLSPEQIGDAVAEIAAFQPDLIVVADYGQYIPTSVIAAAKHPAINIHPSLLPKYRGAAPIQWAIANGDALTGVTIQYVAKKMDAGDILLQQEFEIGDEESAESLEPRLAEAGAQLLLRALDLIEAGRLHATPQNESQATLAPKLTKEDGRIDWSMPAVQIANRVRAFQPWPGCWTQTDKGTLKILRTQVSGFRFQVSAPGTVVGVENDGLIIVTGNGALSLLKVQPESKKPMSGADYARGARLQIGDRLGG